SETTLSPARVLALEDTAVLFISKDCRSAWCGSPDVRQGRLVGRTGICIVLTLTRAHIRARPLTPRFRNPRIPPFNPHSPASAADASGSLQTAQSKVLRTNLFPFPTFFRRSTSDWDLAFAGALPIGIS